jgi:hypothetical protein
MPFFEDTENEQPFDWGRRDEEYKLKKWVNEIFELYDTDKNNVLDKEELKEVLFNKEKSDFAEKYKIKKWFHATFGLKYDEESHDFMGIEDEIFE